MPRAKKPWAPTLKERLEERAERKYQVAALRLQGWSVEDLAAEYGLSWQTVQEYIKEVRKSQASLLAVTAEEHVDTELQRNDLIMQENWRLLEDPTQDPRNTPMHMANLIRAHELRYKLLGIDHYWKGRAEKDAHSGTITVKIEFEDLKIHKSSGEAPREYQATLPNGVHQRLDEILGPGHPNPEPVPRMDTLPNSVHFDPLDPSTLIIEGQYEETEHHPTAEEKEWDGYERVEEE